jgi:predicted Zn-dependent peptidase
MKTMNINKLIASIVPVGLAALLSACPAAGPKAGIQPIVAPPVDGELSKGDTTTTTDAPLVFPEDAFRASIPKAGDPRPFNLPGITRFKLANQIDVFLVERHELPTISISLNFDGGEVSDRNGREGSASICMSMASEGTKKLDKLAFDEALADTASNVSSYAGNESQGVTMRSLTKNFDATFALFSDTLTEPGFREEDLKRMVQRRLEALKQQKGSPRSVAGRLLGSTIYGPKHPFGSFSTEKSLAKIKINDCKSHYKAYIKPQGARLFVVGDMTQAQITEKFAPLMAKWKGKPKKVAKIPKPKSRKGRVFFVDIPGAKQSSIYVSHGGPGRMDKNYYANQMMAGVLGGGFSSRINMNLREDKGYSYGARGSFSYNRHFGTFIASSSVRSNSTSQSLHEIFGEMSSIKDGSRAASTAELEREQNGAILGLPARFATAGQVLSMYRRLVYFDLPMNYYNEYVKNYQAVTIEQVNQAAASLLHPEDTIVLVVGDGDAKQIVRGDDDKDVPRMGSDGETQATLRDTLKELAASDMGGKGKMVQMDADGKVLKK